VLEFTDSRYIINELTNKGWRKPRT